MTDNLMSKFITLKCNIVKDGKDSKFSQNFKTIKLTAASEDLFSVFNKITPILNGSGPIILKTDVSELSE